MKTKVAFITPSLYMGGAERWIQYLVNYIDKDRFEVIGIQHDSYEYNSLGLHPLIINEMNAPIYIREHDLRKSHDIKHERIHIYDCDRQTIVPELKDADVFIVWGLTRINDLFAEITSPAPVVWVAHCMLSYWWNDALSDPSKCGRVDWVVSVSDRVGDSVKDNLDRPHRVIYNGIDINKAIPFKSKEHMKQVWGFNHSDIVVGYLGRTVKDKNLIPLIETIKMLPEKYKLLLVGNGRDQDEIWSYARQSLLDRVRISSSVDPVCTALGAMDTFCMLSVAEGFNLAMTEAMAASVPVIANNVGHVPMINKEFGRVVFVPRTLNSVDIANAIVEAIDPGNFFVVENARKMVFDRYSMFSFCRKWEDFLTEVTSKNQTSNRRLYSNRFINKEVSPSI